MCECTHLVQYTHYLANSSPNSSEVLAISSKSEDAKKYRTGLLEATKPTQPFIWKFELRIPSSIVT